MKHLKHYRALLGAGVLVIACLLLQACGGASCSLGTLPYPDSQGHTVYGGSCSVPF